MTIVDVFRCKICGEVYIGSEKPTHCPFCGAHKELIIFARDEDINYDVELSETDKKLVEKALELEIDNSRFYLCSNKNTKSIEGKSMFKRLAKIEYEHAEVWGKILKTDIPKREAGENCSEDYNENLKKSHEREERAINFYKEAAEQSENERIKEIFKAFVDVEKDHLQLSEKRM